ncbi:MAG: sulfurtransferase TusA family protein [Acidilobaceae archaeon]
MQELEYIEKGVYKLDLTGYACPYPQILTLQALKKLEVDDLLEVITDNPPSCENVPAVVRRNGHIVLGIEKIGVGLWKIRIKKAK